MAHCQYAGQAAELTCSVQELPVLSKYRQSRIC